MNASIVGLLAETDLHPGAGQSLGTIDQPVAREGGTDYPVIVGSSFKGAMRGAMIGPHDNKAELKFFGGADGQGLISFGDVRLLLLPIRCSKGNYRWVTCPHLLERFDRDAVRSGYGGANVSLRTSIKLGEVFTQGGGNIYLEEFVFRVTGSVDSKIVTAIRNLLSDDEPYKQVSERVEEQILIMHDDDFGWFARHGLPVQARNALNRLTKESTHLWYEEYLPSDAILYTVLAPRSGDTNGSFSEFLTELENHRWLQLGGNESVGQGICRLHVWKKNS